MAQYGIIGKSLGHSFSPAIFNKFFKDNDLSHTYNTYEIARISDLFSVIEKNRSLEGLNITIPYKEEIIPFLDTISPEAEKIGAVNTIHIFRHEESFSLHGYNTDSFGFQETLKSLEQRFKNALILGTGGAAKAVEYVLSKNNIPYIGVSRNPVSAKIISYDSLDQSILKSTDLLINTTPLGMYPDVDKMPNVTVGFLHKEMTVIDLIYNPKQTLLLKKAELKGCKTVNGALMLKMQAQKAWKIWKK